MKFWTGILMAIILLFAVACGADTNFKGSNLQPAAHSPNLLTGTPDNKLGICHRTGLVTHPWEYNEIDSAAIPVHQSHGDVFGVHSQADCDALSGAATPGIPTMTPLPMTAAATQFPNAATPAATEASQKVGICHRTGSTTNPYVYIVVSVNAVNAHRKHGDIIGVEAPNDCPKTLVGNNAKGNQGNGKGHSKGKDKGKGNENENDD